MKHIILILVSAFVLTGCGGGGGSKLPKVGEVTYVNQQCLSATSEANFDELNKVCNRRDETALEEMISEGKVFVIHTSDRGKMVKHSFGKCYVDINGKGKVWIATEFIKSK